MQHPSGSRLGQKFTEGVRLSTTHSAWADLEARSAFWWSLRAVVDSQFFSHLHVFAGPTLNIAWPTGGRVIARLPHGSVGPAAMWVGGALGVGF